MNENESKKVPEVILAPLTGKAVPLREVPDPVFSDKVLGDGWQLFRQMSAHQMLSVTERMHRCIGSLWSYDNGIMDHFIIRHLQKYKAKRKSK